MEYTYSQTVRNKVSPKMEAKRRSQVLEGFGLGCSAMCLMVFVEI